MFVKKNLKLLLSFTLCLVLLPIVSIAQVYDIGIRLDGSRFNVGDTITATLTPFSGNKPYKMSGTWIFTDAETGEITREKAEFFLNETSFTPSRAGTGYLSAMMVDSKGYYGRGDSNTFTVSPAIEPLKGRIRFLTYPISGVPVTATWEISGGTPPYEVTYAQGIAYDMLGNAEGIDATIEGDTCTFTIPEDTFEVEVGIVVHDAAGQTEVLFSTPWSVITIHVHIDSIKLDHTNSALDVNEEMQINATIIPEDATLKPYWVSSNPEVAIVSNTGLVTGISPGKATITAKSPDSKQAFADCAVLVYDSSKSIIGDANNNKYLDIMDAVILIEHIVLGTPLLYPENTDTNTDQLFDIQDLMFLVEALQ